MQIRFLEKPRPDFERLAQIVKGEEKPQRVHFVELLVDEDVVRTITMEILGHGWVPESSESDSSFKEKAAYWQQNINFFYRMGYDCVPDLTSHRRFQSLLKRDRFANDTAPLSVGRKRLWAQEGVGMIDSWESFERFPWEKVRNSICNNNEDYYDFLGRNLPEGMRIASVQSLFEQVLEWILGYEGLFYQLSENPALVKAVFDRLGQILYDFYSDVASLEIVGALWHADDMGHKTGTMISPKDLRTYLFPWLVKFSQIAHEHGKMFWLHSCGNLREVMDDLIGQIGVDAFHSFQNSIMTIQEFRRLYNDRTASFGGVDVDDLCRLRGDELRRHIRAMLQDCLPDGRYALGTGNSVCNYIPVENYLLMLQEGLSWKI